MISKVNAKIKRCSVFETQPEEHKHYNTTDNIRSDAV